MASSTSPDSRLARGAFVSRHARAITRGALAVGGAWALAGVTVMTRADVAGALCMTLLAILLLRSRVPTLYACMFACVALLEVFGTAIGTWRWAELGPNFALPRATRPAGSPRATAYSTRSRSGSDRGSCGCGAPAQAASRRLDAANASSPVR